MPCGGVATIPMFMALLPVLTSGSGRKGPGEGYCFPGVPRPMVYRRDIILPPFPLICSYLSSFTLKNSTLRMSFLLENVTAS